MSAIGGSITNFSVGGRLMRVDAEKSPEIERGGWKNEVKANGDGTTRTTRKRVPWRVGGLLVVIDNANEDQEFLQELTDGGEDFVVSFTLADGTILQGTGNIVSDITLDAEDTTIELEFKGGGKLTPQ